MTLNEIAYHAHVGPVTCRPGRPPVVYPAAELVTDLVAHMDANPHGKYKWFVVAPHQIGSLLSGSAKIVRLGGDRHKLTPTARLIYLKVVESKDLNAIGCRVAYDGGHRGGHVELHVAFQDDACQKQEAWGQHLERLAAEENTRRAKANRTDFVFPHSLPDGLRPPLEWAWAVLDTELQAATPQQFTGRGHR